MSFHSRKYSLAAKEGNMDILEDISRRECNKPDGDGMTPTLWSAYNGNLWALRHLTSRGGNPDAVDLLGNSALHHAAANGHMNCVQYLVSFGCNIWAVDIEDRTALHLASLRNHYNIVKYLDSAAARQLSKNRKTVEKLKIKSITDSEKIRKKYNSLLEDTQKRMEKENNILGHGTSPKKSSGNLHRVVSKLRGKAISNPKRYSEHFSSLSGFKTVKSERNLIVNLEKHFKNVLQKNWTTRSMPTLYSKEIGKVGKQFSNNDSGIASDDGNDFGVLKRPGFGNLTFLPKSFTPSAYSPQDESTNKDIATTSESIYHCSLQNKNLYSYSLIKDTDIDCTYEERTHLTSFLAANDLRDISPTLENSYSDFYSLLSMTKSELSSIDLPLESLQRLWLALEKYKEKYEVQTTYL